MVGSRHLTDGGSADVVLRCAALIYEIAVAIPLTMMLIFHVWMIYQFLSKWQSSARRTHKPDALHNSALVKDGCCWSRIPKRSSYIFFLHEVICRWPHYLQTLFHATRS